MARQVPLLLARDTNRIRIVNVCLSIIYTAGDESQILEIDDVILHPMYDFTKAYQDIAVIKLKANQGKL